jgi:hypothetical protein
MTLVTQPVRPAAVGLLLVVWAICAVAALVAAVVLGLMPRPEAGDVASVTVEA